MYKSKEKIVDFNNEIIAINGVESSGKAVFTTTLASAICKKHNVKVLIIDLGNEPKIHRFFGMKKYSKKLEKIIKGSNENIFNISINDLMQKYKNISILSGLNLRDLYNNSYSNDEQIRKEIGSLKNEFDLILVYNPNEFNNIYSKTILENSNKIIFVSEASLLSISSLKKHLEKFHKEINIPQERLNIVFNKTSKYSIDRNILKNVFFDYNILADIRNDEKIEKWLNKGEIYFRKLNKIDRKAYEKIIMQVFGIKKKKGL